MYKFARYLTAVSAAQIENNSIAIFIFSAIYSILRYEKMLEFSTYYLNDSISWTKYQSNNIELLGSFCREGICIENKNKFELQYYNYLISHNIIVNLVHIWVN